MSSEALSSCITAPEPPRMRSSLRVNRRPPTEIIAEQRGDEPLDVAAILAENPQLWADRSAVVDLVYEEYCQRLEAGEVIDAQAFCARFPAIADSLKELLSAHRFLLAQLDPEDPHATVRWPEAGESFLGFDLRRELGRGAFARVFLAAEPALGHRLVAVKIAFQGAAEAETLGRLQHPHIVPIHSVHVDSASGLSAVCMPYLGQATLCDVLDRVAGCPGADVKAAVFLETARTIRHPVQGSGGRAEPDPVLVRGDYLEGVALIGLRLAEALAYTHGQGIFHGDLKPSNVLLSPDGRPLLLDFNLSLDEQLVARVLGGTLPYMAPEQLRALDQAGPDRVRAIDGRSDLFSLGVILYELATGRLPFGPLPRDRSARELRDEMLRRQVEGGVPVHLANPRADKALAEVIERCLVLEPAGRLQTAGDLAAALRQYVSRRQRLRRRVCRRWRPLLVGLTGLVAIASVGGWQLAELQARRGSRGDREMRAGLEAYHGGYYQDAADHFSRVLQADPSCAHAYFARARAYQRLGEQGTGPEAIQTYMRGAENDCREALRYVSDGRIKAAQGYYLARGRNPMAAAACFQQALDMGYESAEVYNDLAFVGALNGQAPLQVDDLLRKASERDPTLPAIEATRKYNAIRKQRNAKNVATRHPMRLMCLIDPVKDFPE